MYIKKPSENGIIVINSAAYAALTMQTERKCLVVEEHHMRSLSDRGRG